ncbi:MAG: tRNA pseudouridine(38-40) synthase TruA [Actinomycetaceae bacterium]|nr:tRNA pseudouridine(38-40) synthase TruA [Actinomycetaceae bacterium]
MTVRLRLDLSYDGTHFHGWAAQPDLRTVQGEIESALATIIRTPVTLTVAGRTDAGVHARSQVCHCDLPRDFWETKAGRDIPTDSHAPKLARRLNSMLSYAYCQWAASHGISAVRGQSDCVIHQIQAVDDTFDARFAATGREYSYRVADATSHDPLRRHDVTWIAAPVDGERMASAAQALLGTHDFLSYCRPREGATTIRTLTRLDIDRDTAGILTFHVGADAFCHSMVRSLVGALLEVGCGRRPPQWPGELLAAQSRQSAAPIAPAHGLTLEKVTYPPPDQWATRIAQARQRRDSQGPASATGPAESENTEECCS